MGLEKLGMSLAQRTYAWVKATGKNSILQTKPIKPTELTVLRSQARLNKDTVCFSNSLRNNLNLLKSDELVNYTISRGGSNCEILKLGDDEILNIIKNGNITSSQREQLIHLLNGELKGDFTSYLLTKKGINIFEASPEIIDKYGEIANMARIKFIKVFDDLLFPKSKNSSVINFENKLANLGVDARLTDHIEEAEIIYISYKNMYDKGIREFPKVRFSLEKNGINEAIPNKLPSEGYVIYTDCLLSEGKNANKGWFANPTPEGIVYHEAGHILNNMGYSKTALGNIDEYRKNAIAINIPEKVSEYSYCPDEFGAEVFSGLMAGKIYPQEIMQVYNSYNGYIPPLLK